MMGALAIAERDVRKFARQPALMLSAVIGPFLYMLLLGYAFGGAITFAPVAIVRQSYGQSSSELIDIMRTQLSCQYGGVNCKDSFVLSEIASLDSAQDMLMSGAVKAVVYIPKGFDQSVAAGIQPTITVYLDNTDPVSAAAVSSDVASAGQQLSAQVQITTPSSILGVIPTDYYRNIFYIEFMAPGSLVQAIMFASIVGGGVAILEDKERGILEGYLVSPLKQYEIILGVLLGGVVKAMFSAGAVFALAVIVGAIRPDADIVGYGLMLFTLLLTSLGLISMMTAYAIRSTSTNGYRFTSFPVNLILYFTSGAVYPVSAFPVWMQKISIVNPEAYAVHALRLLMYKGATVSTVLGDFTFLVVFTGIMVALATAMFRRAL
jgi:ABC-2 type transport system permease protein